MGSSAQYWEAAALEREEMLQFEAEEQVNKLLRLYEEAYNDLQDEIKKIEYNYSVRFGVDAETASKYLSRELNKQSMNELAELLLKCNEEERAKILEYIQRDGLSTRAYGARASRYKELQDIIQTRAMKLSVAARAVGEDIIKTAYRNNYYRLIDDTAFGLDCGVSFTLIDDNALETVLNKRWSGKRFSERVWTNTQKLADETQDIIARYIISGRSYTKAIKEIQDRFDVAQTRATTLIRTEMAHARTEGDLKAYEELEIEEYKFMASLDERTCDECAPLDGQVFKLSEAVEGVNYPVIHPRCRCTTTVNMDYLKRRAYNPVTGKSELIDGSVTYEEWVNNMTAEEKAAFDTARKKRTNAAADKLQHQRYRELLGKDVPKGFDKWQELKYNNSERYAELKGFYRYKQNNDKATINDYRCAKELKELLPQGSFHIPAKDIDVSKLGVDNEHINKERLHKVTETEAKEFVKNAKVSRTVWSGQYERCYTYEGVSYVDNKNKLIRTAFKKDEFKGDVVKILEVLKRYGI